jgi:hypothetical protein
MDTSRSAQIRSPLPAARCPFAFVRETLRLRSGQAQNGKRETVYIPVYWSRTPAKAAPDFHITRADALALRERGEAFPIRRGRALRMRVPQAAVSPIPTRVIIRDASCYMDEPVILANADGDRYAAELVTAWAVNHAGFRQPGISGQQPVASAGSQTADQ